MNRYITFCRGISSAHVTAYHSGAPEFTPGFYWGSCYSIFRFMCMFVDRCLYFCTFSFGHCVVCSSSIYGFWLPLWYRQTLLTTESTTNKNVDITFGAHDTFLEHPSSYSSGYTLHYYNVRNIEYVGWY
jgi:hypothetical protein